MSTDYDVIDLRGMHPTDKAIVRATEDGRNVQGLNEYLQAQVLGSTDARKYRLAALFVPPGSPVHILCNCPAGQFRPYLDIPCRHAGRLLLSMQRRGLCDLDESGTYIMNGKAHQALLDSVRAESGDTPLEISKSDEMSPELKASVFG